MDGMLSQDEINALLSGMDPGGFSSESDSTQSAGSGSSDSSEVHSTTSSAIDESLLTDIEKDAIGEVANISMGTSATTLYSLVNRKVNITTPVVTLANWDNLIENYEKPCVFIQIRYSVGLEGTNILVLKEHDVKVITDLMMGGDGTNLEGELGELHLSAISEAMNQMMGSSATSLSSMLGKKIDITPPEASLVDLQAFAAAGNIASFLEGTFVKISFRMQIDELVDSMIMQLYPLDFARSLVETFIEQQKADMEPAAAEPPMDASGFSGSMDGYSSMGGQMPMGDMSGGMGMNPMNNMGMQQDPYGQMGMNPMNGMGMNPMNGMGMNPMNGMGMNPMNNMGMNPMNGMGMPNQVMGYGQMGGMQQATAMNQGMNVQQAQFQNFTSDFGAMVSQENIDLIKDVPLEVTVELGRTKKSISDILDFAPGTIIELDRIAGEPIDVLVNGKFVARGEVVAVDESFGIRVTEIIK